MKAEKIKQINDILWELNDMVKRLGGREETPALISSINDYAGQIAFLTKGKN
jgi:hypothetical protein